MFLYSWTQVSMNMLIGMGVIFMIAALIIIVGDHLEEKKKNLESDHDIFN